MYIHICMDYVAISAEVCEMKSIHCMTFDSIYMPSSQDPKSYSHNPLLAQRQ